MESRTKPSSAPLDTIKADNTYKLHKPMNKSTDSVPSPKPSAFQWGRTIAPPIVSKSASKESEKSKSGIEQLIEEAYNRSEPSTIDDSFFEVLQSTRAKSRYNNRR